MSCNKDEAERWNKLSYDSAAHILSACGHATWFAGHNWIDLAAEIRRDVTAYWRTHKW